MNKTLAFPLLLTLFVVLLIRIAYIQPVKSQVDGIFIKPDGNVNPPTAPIQREGDTYILTDNIINNFIIIQRDNVMIDGANFTIQGQYPAFSDAGIHVSGRSNITIKNATIVNFKTGINIEYTTNSTIMENTITTFEYEDGIHLFNSTNNKISNNIIISLADLTRTQNIGIYLRDSSINTISENNVTGSYWGIYLQTSNNNTVSGNKLTLSSTAIEITISSENEIFNNIVSDTVWAPSRGVFANSGNGIELNNASNNQVCGNNVTDNGVGIRVWFQSSNNAIYNNNFINNTQQVSLLNQTQATNFWDNGVIGNYWSDYAVRYPNATEIDNSGIWNTPYVIDASNVDHYPLTKPAPASSSIPPPSYEFLLGTAIIVIAVIAVILMVYFKKRKR